MGEDKIRHFRTKAIMYTCIAISIILLFSFLSLVSLNYLLVSSNHREENSYQAEDKNYASANVELTEKETVDYMTLIENSKKLTVKKEPLSSLFRKYTLYVDGKEVGNISGNYINHSGSTLTLIDLNDNIIAKEKNIQRHGKANITNQNDNTIGYIQEDPLSKNNFHIFDSNQNKIAYTKKFANTIKIYNTSNEIIYEIDKDPLIDSYTIVKQKENNISISTILIFTCMANMHSNLD